MTFIVHTEVDAHGRHEQSVFGFKASDVNGLKQVGEGHQGVILSTNLRLTALAFDMAALIRIDMDRWRNTALISFRWGV
jgi:hypothetical protein